SGDATGRYASAKARKNYAGTSPITRQSGRSKTAHARFIHNDRLVDALHLQAGCAVLHDPEVRAYYDRPACRDASEKRRWGTSEVSGFTGLGGTHGCFG
ncbi:IS110 family transposase, partial [Microbispora sp. ATCC PTA-5024]|uniref:IS110 family transposase n=1 Tax=Microbispora sp. ATCC PTA-5024 TaxID=316330 RepID=UPI001E4E5C9F